MGTGSENITDLEILSHGLEGGRSSNETKHTSCDEETNNGHTSFSYKVYLILAYVLFLIWRITSLILYVIYSTDCFFRAKLATLRCENFTVFPSPTRLEIAWQVSSSLNCVIAIVALSKLPFKDFPGFGAILKRLVEIARFWSLLGQLLVVVVYNTILFFHEHLLESALIELGFILDEISITTMVCLWNFVPAPTGFRACYYATLVVFFLENFYLFLLMSSQAALDITGIHEFENRAKGLQALGIVLNATEATFYFAIMKFFWKKMFERDTGNLLAKETF